MDIRFVEDIKQRVATLKDGTFIYYSHGYQFYTDFKYMLRVYDPKNHFVSIVEQGVVDKIKTVYGYGSHYYIDKIKGARIALDGSTPTDQSLEYEGPITLSETTVVKAIAIKDGVSSAVTSRTYTKGTNAGGGDEVGNGDID